MNSSSWVPTDTCTLPTPQQPLRVAEFDALFATALRGMKRVSQTRLRLELAADAEPTARELTERESACCSFFTFEFIAKQPDSLLLEIEVPPAHSAVLDGIVTRATSA
ncbi:hypothetical protein [Nocardia arthritidis]|uniref:Arsenate reductase n=1 Tax=Nocardia arthritidis TaxID=228602 RepID=A0A6G9YDD5_9NOCA|nr:hypothetical protein [Nocardia arthritidis]QIS11212.1 hypothetical protein F5544_16665 [Nocardia arthritidis]